ncbi:hypothetical protein [Desulfosporosinus burensis]
MDRYGCREGGTRTNEERRRGQEALSYRIVEDLCTGLLLAGLTMEKSSMASSMSVRHTLGR